MKNLFSLIDDFNEGVMEAVSEHKAALILTGIAAITLSGSLFCPNKLVALPCALVTLMISIGFILEGHCHNASQQWLETFNAGTSISDRHGNIVEDEPSSTTVFDANVTINGSLILDGKVSSASTSETDDADGNPLDDQFPLPPHSNKH